MVKLASVLLDADIHEVDPRRPSSITRVLSLVRRRKIADKSISCLFICAGPPDLEKILNVDGWRQRFGTVGAWIIDSFWLDHIPKVIRVANPFDRFFVTSVEDVDCWKKLTGTPTTWLPWGTDALRLGSDSPFRKWDVTRVGRQPPEWEHDQENLKVVEPLGIKYRPRPESSGLSTLENQQLIMNAYADTKYVLAFSNLVNPETYTHPTKQYLTGRWVDGLAAGAILAGISPQGDTVDAMLWSGATLEFGTVRRADGLGVLADALKSWRPSCAALNYKMALSKLDWRWRFEVIASQYDMRPGKLFHEIEELKNLMRVL